jgi:hypothetical protein
MSEEPDNSDLPADRSTDPLIDPTAALSNIVDDDTPRHDALRWAADEMI